MSIISLDGTFMDIDKETAIKDLWNAVETGLKSIKTLNTNAFIKEDTIENLWNSITISQTNLRHIHEILMNKIYKWTYYTDEILTFRTEGFMISRVEGFGVKVRVITSSKQKFKYTNIDDAMVLSLDCFSNDDGIKPIDLKPEDLPLLINDLFKGSLFREIINDNKSRKQPKPIPVQPDPVPDPNK